MKGFGELRSSGTPKGGVEDKAGLDGVCTVSGGAGGAWLWR